MWNRHRCHSSICIIWTSHQYHSHCLNTNVICLFILFKNICCMYICVVYIQKSYTQLSCLSNAQHSCLNNMNLWNNRFHTYLKQTHEAGWKHGKICQKNNHTCSHSHIYCINMKKHIQNFFIFIVKQWCTPLSL